MQTSADRILTTHVGTLQRPADLSKLMAEKGEHSPEAHAAAARGGRRGGAQSRSSRASTSSMTGSSARRCGCGTCATGSTASSPATGPGRGGLAEGARPGRVPGVLRVGRGEREASSGYMEDAYFFGAIATQPVVTGPITYRPEAVQRDIANLTDALQGPGRDRRVHAGRCAGQHRGRPRQRALREPGRTHAGPRRRDSRGVQGDHRRRVHPAGRRRLGAGAVGP